MGSTQKLFTYPAMSFVQRGKKAPSIILFHAPVGEVLKWAAPVELGPEGKGPQRAKRPAKIDAIRKFLTSDERNTIPTAVVLAFRSRNAEFAASKGAHIGTVRVLAKKNSASIVDGQHRLDGMFAFDPNVQVAIVGLLGVDAVEEAFQFLVINNKATKVPTVHVKSLLAKMHSTALARRLAGAKMALDVAGVRDVDILNLDKDSPFFQSVAWPSTTKSKQMIPATALEMSLEYMGSLAVPEYEDRDVRRSVFMAIWRSVRARWPDLWRPKMRLVSKVGIICLTRFTVEKMVAWADNDHIEISLGDLDDVEEQTRKILSYMDGEFWTAPWAEKAQGGFDTAQGRERVYDAITMMYRNLRRRQPWSADIDILDSDATRK